MEFQAGHQKLGGRAPGTPNKDKRTVREIVETVLGKSLPEAILELSEKLNKDPKEKAKILSDLMPYCYGKIAPKDPNLTQEDMLTLNAALLEKVIASFNLKKDAPG